MYNRNSPVHVASIKSNLHGKVYETHLLRRTYRDGDRVMHQTLGNISHLPRHIIDIIKGSLRGETYVPLSEAFNVIRSLPHGHVAAVLGVLRKLDMERGLATRPSKQRDLAVAMVVSQVINPGSELATYPSNFGRVRHNSPLWVRLWDWAWWTRTISTQL